MFPRSLRQFVRVLPRTNNVVVNARAFSTGKQGFASMDPQKQRDIASKGGQASNSGQNKASDVDHNQARNLGQNKAPELHKAPHPYIVNPNRGVNPAKRVTQPEAIQFKIGDLVRYNRGANTTEGIIKAIHDHPVRDEFGRVHQATAENPMAEVENHYTKNIVFLHFSALHWLARHEDMPAAYQENATANRTSTQTQQSSKKVEPEQIHQDSPLQIDFAPGDIVRFHYGPNVTAGQIEAIYISPQHDEFGNFHKASKENPMARIINLWTKKPVYHHLNVLEFVNTGDTGGHLYMESSHGRGVPAGTFFESTETTEFSRATAPPAGSARTTSQR